MALPTITVRIAFDTAPFATTPTWTDVSSDFLSLDIRRGRKHFLNRMDVGTADIKLYNSSGNYWPDNAGGSYYGDVLPGKRINIRAEYNSITYDLYTGFIEAWRPEWLVGPVQVPTMRLQCADLLKNLGRLEITDGTGYSAELSGTRIGNILDDLDWPAGDRDLDAGQTTVIASGALTEENALTHARLVSQSELGILYQAGDGDVQFEDRHHRLKSPHETSQATFGDDAGEMKYSGLVPIYDDSYIFNDVRVTRSGGSQQSATDATSQTTYGVRCYSLDGLLMAGDTEAASMANYLLKRFKDASLRPQGVLVLPARDEANLYPKILGYDISTRITLRLNQASLDSPFFIEGIHHKYAAKDGAWSTTWQLSEAGAQAYWLLNTVGFSEINETTWLSY